MRLEWMDLNQVFASRQLPVVLGRSPQAHYRVDDSRVSRSHARLDWHGGSFQLSDLSYNGTYVRFADGEIVSLRRGSCLLHGSGVIGLGGSPADPTSACVRFEVLRFGDSQMQPLG
jgi:pSer/pThr/pTyr-binding forkhead associated (FHA) protein